MEGLTKRAINTCAYPNLQIKEGLMLAKISITCTLVLLLTGCLHKTPRTYEQVWRKQGQSLEEIQAEMKICGYKQPMSGDERARFETCMYKKGYIMNFGIKSACVGPYIPSACKERDFPTPAPNR